MVGRRAFLQTWAAHRLPGVRVFPQGQEIQAGAAVVVTLGTPPGHPEQGEEAFVVSLSSDETVRFDGSSTTSRGAHEADVPTERNFDHLEGTRR